MKGRATSICDLWGFGGGFKGRGATWLEGWKILIYDLKVNLDGMYVRVKVLRLFWLRTFKILVVLFWLCRRGFYDQVTLFKAKIENFSKSWVNFFMIDHWGFLTLLVTFDICGTFIFVVRFLYFVTLFKIMIFFLGLFKIMIFWSRLTF